MWPARMVPTSRRPSQRELLSHHYLDQWNRRCLVFFDYYAKMSQFSSLWRNFTCGQLEHLLNVSIRTSNLPFQIRQRRDDTTTTRISTRVSRSWDWSIGVNCRPCFPAFSITPWTTTRSTMRRYGCSSAGNAAGVGAHGAELGRQRQQRNLHWRHARRSAHLPGTASPGPAPSSPSGNSYWFVAREDYRPIGTC